MRVPTIFLMHPVGTGSTRAMNVFSAKLWVRALVDTLPNIAISAPWLPYAEVNIDRGRGLRDMLSCIEGHDGAVAVGGDFSDGMHDQWNLFDKLKRPRIDLTKPPMPTILSQETFGAATTPEFRKVVCDAFAIFDTRRAA